MNQLYLAGEWIAGSEVQPVISPFDGHTVAEVHRAYRTLEVRGGMVNAAHTWHISLD